MHVYLLSLAEFRELVEANSSELGVCRVEEEGRVWSYGAICDDTGATV